MPSWLEYPFVHRFTADAGKAQYASSTDILYIGKAGGKASTLRQRVRFAVGKVSNHRGGEWLWLLDGIDKAEVRNVV